MKRVNKKAISDIVSTVLIIMIAVAAVGVIGAFVVPMIRDNLGTGTACTTATSDLYIDSSSGFSCMDLTKGILPVQITKGSGQITYAGAKVAVISAGNSYMFNINSTFPNSKETFYLNLGNLKSVDSIDLSPIVRIGSSNKVCSKSSSVQLSQCNLETQIIEQAITDQKVVAREGYSSSALGLQARVLPNKINGLVRYWDFNEGNYNSTHVFDVSGNNQHGIRSGGVIVEENVAKFDGSNISKNKIIVGAGNNYFPLPLFTLCSFAKKVGSNQGSVSGIFYLTYGFGIAITTDNRLYFTTNNGTTSPSSTLGVYSNEFLKNNTWYQICETFNGSERNIYLDSVKIKTDLPKWNGSTAWPTSTVVIGHNPNNGIYYYFNGSLDEIMIFNRSLSSEEIKSIYETQKK